MKRVWRDLTAAAYSTRTYMYKILNNMYGKGVPVRLGTVDLILPYYYDSGVYEDFMFLSWAGRPLSQYSEVKAGVINGVSTILKRIHNLGVLHCDAEPRNILYDGDRLTVIDFEHAQFRARQPLGSMGANEQNRKRKRAHEPKDEFATELALTVERFSRCVS